jgi:hypothetical protein
MADTAVKVLEKCDNVPSASRRLPRTTLGLRDALFEALDELRGAQPDVAKALATAKLAQAITTCMKAELDLIDRMEDGDMGSFKPGTLTLGTEDDR